MNYVAYENDKELLSEWGDSMRLAIRTGEPYEGVQPGE